MSPEHEPDTTIDSVVEPAKLIQQSGEFAGAITDPSLAEIGASEVQALKQERETEVRANGLENDWTDQNTENTIKTLDMMAEKSDNEAAELAMATDLARKAEPKFDIADERSKNELVKAIQDRMRLESQEAKNNQVREANNALITMSQKLRDGGTLSDVLGDVASVTQPSVESIPEELKSSEDTASLEDAAEHIAAGEPLSTESVQPPVDEYFGSGPDILTAHG